MGDGGDARRRPRSHAPQHPVVRHRAQRPRPHGRRRRVGSARLSRGRGCRRRAPHERDGGRRHPARPPPHARARAPGRGRRDRRLRDRRCAPREPGDAGRGPRARARAARRHRAHTRALRLARAAARHRDGAAAPAQQSRARRDGCRILRPRRAAPHARRSARSAPHAFGPFKTELVAELGALGYFVNEIGIADVVMHIAIAADRVAQDRGAGGHGGGDAPGAAGGRGDHRASRAAAPRASSSARRPAAPRPRSCSRAWSPRAHRAPSDHARSRLDPEVEAAVREVVETAAAEFLVDIVHEDFILRLALHVQNLQHRATRAGVVAQSAHAVARSRRTR